MLLDPFKEQLDLPAGLVSWATVSEGNQKLLVRKTQGTVLLRIPEADAAERRGVVGGRIHPREHDGLIRAQARGLVHAVGVTATVLHILACADDEEGGGQSELIEALEMNVTAIQDVERARFQAQAIELTDIADAAVRDLDNGGNVAVQVQHGVQFNSPFGALKRSPGEQGQAEIDGGGIQRVDRLIEVQAEGIVGIQGASLADENLREVGVNAPVAPLAGVRQSIPRNRAAEAQVIQARPHRAQTRLNVAQTLAV